MMMDGLLDYLSVKHQSKIYKQPIVVSNPQLKNSNYDFKHIISSHPTPDDKSVAASKEILEYVSNSNADDLVVFLISGGGSSLLSLPADGIQLEDKIALTNLLLASGCNINEINTVRKHVSKIKGGRLNSAALPSKTISLIISDVINDDLSSIASGPTVADSSTFVDAINALYLEPTLDPDLTTPPGNGVIMLPISLITFTAISHAERHEALFLDNNIKLPPPIAGTRAVASSHINSPSITGILQNLFLSIRFDI